MVKLLVVLPFFSVKTAADYADRALGKLFSCKKDSFYRLMDDGRIDWRHIIYSINRQLIGFISRRADAKGNTRCVILDDTDLPKRGKKAEGLEKVFSHTAKKCILGFKAMFLCYTDGKTQLMVDATIQAESGKDASKPRAYIEAERRMPNTARSAARTRESTPVRRRCFSPKLPTPSRCSGEPSLRVSALTTCWLTAGFPCAELLQFIHSRHFKCHVIGMIKMGKTKYESALGNLCAPDIIKRLEKAKATKRNRSIGYTCAAVKARYAGMDVQLFFYRKGKGSWNALITTDMGIDAMRAFELYVRRWCIEVAHKEMKGLLNLGKCQCVDFAGQIAALSLCMIQYNILGTVKRFESYETTGGLFAELTGETRELTVVQRIWGLIIEVINVSAEFLSCDPFELTDNKQQPQNQSSEDGSRPARTRRSGRLNHLQNLSTSIFKLR
ncbi:transposase IS4 family [Bacteroides sp. CAG:709]|nr:transposase IS4 family [Bacteroides sp. CAG:709]